MQKDILKDQLIENEMDGLDQVTQSLDQASGHFKKVLNSYQESIEKLNNDIEQKEKVHAQKMNILYQLKKQIEERRVQRQALIKRNAVSIENVEKINANIARYKAEVDKLKIFNEQLVTDCKAMVETRTELEKNMKKLKESYHEVNNEKLALIRTKEDTTSTVYGLNVELESLNKTKHEVEGNIQTTNSQIKDLEYQIVSLNNDCSIRVEQIKNLKTDCSALEVKHQELERLVINEVHQKKMLDGTKEDISQKAHEYTNSIDDLQMKRVELVHGIKSTHSEIKDIKTQIESLQNSKTQKENELKIIKLKSIEAKEEKRVVLSKLNDQTKKFQEAQNLFTSLTQEVELAQRSVDIFTQKNNALYEATAKLEVKTNALDKENNELKLRIEQDKNIYASLLSSRAELEETNKHQTSTNNSVCIEFTTLEKNIKDEQQMVEKLTAQIQSLNASIDSYTKKNEEHKNKYQYSNSYRKNLDFILEEKTKRLAVLKFENDCLDSVVRYLGANLVSIKNVEKRLKEKFVFMDIKVNQILADIPLIQLEKLEVVAGNFYDYAMDAMDDKYSPVMVIKNIDNKILSCSVVLQFSRGHSKESINKVVENISKEIDHQLQHFIHQTDDKFIIDFFI